MIKQNKKMKDFTYIMFYSYESNKVASTWVDE